MSVIKTYFLIKLTVFIVCAFVAGMAAIIYTLIKRK